MNSKTAQPIHAGHPGSEQSPVRSLTAWLSSVGGWIARIGPISRGLMILTVLLLSAVLSAKTLFPTRVTPAGAPPDQFSSERAMAHLTVIAREPHPQGSTAQRRVRDYLLARLEAMGFESAVQTTAGLENVVARLRGSNPTGAIVILSHYDTVSYSPGAGDNGSAVSVLLEVMRAIAAGPTLRNDVIALFDDGEEYPDIFAGTKAFVREHPWMGDVRVAISIDTAVAGFISMNEVGPKNNGWLVHTLAQAYTGGAWMSFSGGGEYNSTPFRDAGIPVLALEDNYPFRQKHSAEDLPEIIHPASVQQMGEQTLSIARVMGNLDLINPWGEQETFFYLPVVGFIHYPQAWSLPLAITAVLFLVTAIALTLWRKVTTWRGMLVAFGSILLSTAASAVIVNALLPRLPNLLKWETTQWEDWPEVIPPHGWLVVSALALLVLGLAIALYVLARRWGARENFSVVGLLPFTIAAVVLAAAEPRTAFAFTWPAMIGSLAWILAGIWGKKPMKWSSDLTTALAALPFAVMLLPFPPGIVMSDGMKSLAILAGIEALLLGVILPAIDGLLVHSKALKTKPVW